MKHLWYALLVLALAHAPRVASACAVCTAGRDDESRAAFLFMPIFMSVTPLALIGGGVFWLWRRAKAVEARNRVPTTASQPPVALNGPR